MIFYLLYLGIIRTFVNFFWNTKRALHVPHEDMPRFIQALKPWAHWIEVIADVNGHGIGVRVDERVLAAYEQWDQFEVHGAVDALVSTVTMFLRPVDQSSSAEPEPGRIRVNLFEIGLHVPAKIAQERTAQRLHEMRVDCMVDEYGNIVVIAWNEKTNLEELFNVIKIDVEVILPSKRPADKRAMLEDLRQAILDAEAPKSDFPFHQSA